MSAPGAMRANRCRSPCKFARKLRWPIDWPVRRKLARPKPSAPSSRVYAAFAIAAIIGIATFLIWWITSDVRRWASAGRSRELARDRPQNAAESGPAEQRGPYRSRASARRIADRLDRCHRAGGGAADGRAARSHKPQHRRARALARRVVDRVPRQPYIYGEAAPRPRPRRTGRHSPQPKRPNR